MRRFGLIGHPLGHSFSQKYFTEKFAREQLEATYDLFDIGLEEFPMVAAIPGMTGLNVTIPYKETVIPLLDDLDTVAATVGAVNTIKVMAGGRLKGYNTDVVGFEVLLNQSGFSGGKALVLGTGGASKAVRYVLEQRGVEVEMVSRDKRKGDYEYGALDAAVIEDHLLIVNTTPLGMAPQVETAPRIPYEAIGDQHMLIDLVYNPEETAFLCRGRAQGAKTYNGLTMLRAQAEASFHIWFL